MTQEQQTVSAQVILRSASGKAPHGRAAITSETVEEYLPSPETVRQARAAFAAQGFQVGGVVGNSFSITAPVVTFERLFKMTLRSRAGGGVEAVNPGSVGSYGLPRSVLPEDLAQHVEAVTFTPPPDFGPGSF